MGVRTVVARGQGKQGRRKEMVRPGVLAFGSEISNKYKTEEIFSKYKMLLSTDSTIPRLGTFGQTDTCARRRPNKDVGCMCIMANGYRPSPWPSRGDQWGQGWPHPAVESAEVQKDGDGQERSPRYAVP